MLVGGALTIGCTKWSYGPCRHCTLDTPRRHVRPGHRHRHDSRHQIGDDRCGTANVTVDVGRIPVTVAVSGQPQRVLGLDKVTYQQVILKTMKAWAAGDPAPPPTRPRILNENQAKSRETAEETAASRHRLGPWEDGRHLSWKMGKFLNLLESGLWRACRRPRSATSRC